jgi:hypothetical protein
MSRQVGAGGLGFGLGVVGVQTSCAPHPSKGVQIISVRHSPKRLGLRIKLTATRIFFELMTVPFLSVSVQA